jgi:hypothetical protein
MAIRRCPYCKAIIDEQDKYCNSCGTQLLFPEDEYVEEDVPGDKIIDKEEESEEESEEEAEEDGKKLHGEYEEGEEEEGTLKEDETEEDKDELESFEEEGENKEGDEEETDKIRKLAEPEKEEAEKEELEFVGEEKGESEELQQEERKEGLKERSPTGEVIEEEEAGPEDRELQSWMELKEEIAKKAQGEGQETQLQKSLEATGEEPSAGIKEREKKYKASIEEDELVFKTKELDKLTRTVEEGKKELEGLLSSFEGKKAVEEKPASETKEELPPWVSGMKEEPPAVTPDQEEKSKETPSPTRRERTTDSGIGIPEKVTQTTLPFTGTMTRKEEREEEKREGQVEEGVEETEGRRPTGFSLKLKAKFVDLVFITAIWLISLGAAAGVMGVSFFKIIFAAPLPVFVFYLILLLLYFFLFLYFLGETLGDHYFSEED